MDILQNKQKNILKKFVKFLKNRLDNFQYDNNICNKLIKIKKYNSLKTIRCPGSIESYGCYNCNSTGYECIGKCGNWVKTSGTFCSNSCFGTYYYNY